MKKIYILLCLITFSFSASKSQEMLCSEEGLSKFLISTVYVPITGNKVFDEALQKGFSKYWKITPYKFLEHAEFSKLEKENEQEHNKRTRTQPKSFLFTWGGNTFVITDICGANTFAYGDENMLESKWLKDGTAEFSKVRPADGYKTIENVAYRLEYIVKAMNDMITFTKDNKLGNDPVNHRISFQEGGNYLSTTKGKMHFSDMHHKLSLLFNSNAKIIKEKTLVLNRDMKYANKKVYKDEEAFAKYYPYKYKFVSDAEFKAILKGEQAEYVCFIPSYWQGHMYMQAFEFVYEPATKSTIYMGFIEKFSRVEKPDIDLLKRAIGK